MADSVNELKPPVLVVGGTRSGTSILAKLLGAAPGHCLWYEPNIIWRIGSAYSPDDAVDATVATRAVRRKIHRLFLEYQRRHDGARVVEKTPYNVLRVGFLHAVFPDARIVHIYRDGRANLRSQLDRFENFRTYNVTSGRSAQVIRERLSTIPWWEWPAYLPRAAGGLFRSYVTKQKPGWWGVRYPGWREDRGRLSKTKIAAKQWVVAVTEARRALAELPRDAWFETRYEDLVTNPRESFDQIARFIGMDDEARERLVDAAGESVRTSSLTKWRDELEPGVLDEAMPIMGDLLDELGYLADDDRQEALAEA
ncbi:MAG: sulfotransferase [Planctomycetota bacterium]